MMDLKCVCFFFNYAATTEIDTYVHTLSLHDALPISMPGPTLCRIHACEPVSAATPMTSCVAVSTLTVEEPPVSSRPKSESSSMTALQALPGEQVNVISCVTADFSSRKIGRAHVELQSLMRISYAVFCLKKKNSTTK